MAVYTGKFGDAVAQFGGGLIDSRILRERTTPVVHAFVVIGCLTLVLNGLMYSFWSMFGEQQARRVREELFRTLLEKDLNWFEARESGVASLLTRLQT
jgi:ATP-binding cassette, subfamily B (MDR/TAP), member 1